VWTSTERRDGLEIRPALIEDIASCQEIFDESYADLHRRYGIEHEDR
jgi:hypothetical protein